MKRMMPDIDIPIYIPVYITYTSNTKKEQSIIKDVEKVLVGFA